MIPTPPLRRRLSDYRKVGIQNEKYNTVDWITIYPTFGGHFARNDGEKNSTASRRKTGGYAVLAITKNPLGRLCDARGDSALFS
jgi:hypothetical protein